MISYRVQLIARDGTVLNEKEVSADTAEAAAVTATGESRLQNGNRRTGLIGHVLRAKVYKSAEGITTLTLFYGPAAEGGTVLSSEPSVEDSQP